MILMQDKILKKKIALHVKIDLTIINSQRGSVFNAPVLPNAYEYSCT